MKTYQTNAANEGRGRDWNHEEESEGGAGLQGLVTMRRFRAVVLVVLFGMVGLSGCAAGPAIPVPTVSPPPLSFDNGFHQDYVPKMVACMKEKGWDAIPNEDGGFRIKNAPEQQWDQLNKDSDACEAKFGFNETPPALSIAQLRELYVARLWDWGCLDKAGFNPDRPPSEQTFIDGYRNGKGSWTPYGQYTGSMPKDQLKRLYDTCPPTS